MIIYLAENTMNGMRYVGASCRELPQRRIEHKSQSGSRRRLTRFHAAIREHGWDAFEWRVLEVCPSVNELRAAEQRWVAELKTNEKALGYNDTAGGCGVVGHRVSAETRAKLSAAGKRQPPRSEETRRKLSLANKGKRPSDACIAALRRPRSEEVRARMRDAGKRRGFPKLTEESKRRQAIARRLNAEQGVGCKIPPTAKEEILGRRRAGEPYHSIGASYSVTASAVLYFCKRHSA